MNRLYWAFFRGMAAMAGGLMAYQDWLGLEAYLVHAKEHWVDLHWTVGAGLLLVVCACQVFIEIEDHVTRRRDRLRREESALRMKEWSDSLPPPGTFSS